MHCALLRFCSMKPPIAQSLPSSAATPTWFAPRGSGAASSHASRAGS